MVGVTWQLAAYQKAGADVDISAAPVTLQFSADGHASGSGGCDNYSGGYTAGAGGQLTFSPLISTKKFCAPDAIMTLESSYLQALQGVNAYKLNGTTQLELTSSGQDTLRYTMGAPAQMPRTGDGSRDVLAALTALGALALLAGLGLRRRAIG
jgi:heat shock protein HslJ